MNKKIAIFGHRKIDEKDKNYLEKNLIVTFKRFLKKEDKTFLFGSKSEFNDLCYIIISNFQHDYTGIERVGYLCANEIAFTKDEQANYIKFIEKLKLKGKDVKIYEDIKQLEFENKNLYIERNKKMIDDADICIFYYKQECLNPTNNMGIKTNSGTKIALEYAKEKKKEIILIDNK